jgi:hypothetical protein
MLMERVEADKLKSSILGMNEKIDELSRVMKNFVTDVAAISEELNEHVDVIIELNNTELGIIMKEILGDKEA